MALSIDYRHETRTGFGSPRHTTPSHSREKLRAALPLSQTTPVHPWWSCLAIPSSQAASQLWSHKDARQHSHCLKQGSVQNMRSGTVSLMPPISFTPAITKILTKTTLHNFSCSSMNAVLLLLSKSW
uniref:Uncharacterized protein n=1 Tax=Rhipicephalus microplus TaxID=6941 RepID=A0A6G5AIA8_RHIMP